MATEWHEVNISISCVVHDSELKETVEGLEQEIGMLLAGFTQAEMNVESFPWKAPTPPCICHAPAGPPSGGPQ